MRTEPQSDQIGWEICPTADADAHFVADFAFDPTRTLGARTDMTVPLVRRAVPETFFDLDLRQVENGCSEVVERRLRHIGIVQNHYRSTIRRSVGEKGFVSPHGSGFPSDRSGRSYAHPPA